MYVKYEDSKLINTLRREQGCPVLKSWEEVELNADKALSGSIDFCKRYKLRLAEVGYTLDDGTTYLDLAWPSEKIAVSLSSESKIQAESQGWKVWSMIESIEDFSNLARYVR
jgi:hypothetical protein